MSQRQVKESALVSLLNGKLNESSFLLQRVILLQITGIFVSHKAEISSCEFPKRFKMPFGFSQV